MSDKETQEIKKIFQQSQVVNVLQVLFTLEYHSRVKVTRENLLSALKKGMQAEFNDPSIGVSLND